MKIISLISTGDTPKNFNNLIENEYLIEIETIEDTLK